MPTIELAIRPPLPDTAEGIKTRLDELIRFKIAVEEEIKAILGANRHFARETYLCLRCGNQWQPKKIFVVPPRQCAKCKSTYWNKPRIYELKVKKARTKATLPEPVKPNPMDEPMEPMFEKLVGLPPPPPAPASLRERLAAMQNHNPCKSMYQGVLCSKEVGHYPGIEHYFPGKGYWTDDQADKPFQYMQQSEGQSSSPTAESSGDTPSLQTNTENRTLEESPSPATDGADSKDNESEQESLSDA